MSSPNIQCVQLIQPKLAKTMQKPPTTAVQALRPPSGGGAWVLGWEGTFSGSVEVDFSGSVCVRSGAIDSGAEIGGEDSVKDFAMTRRLGDHRYVVMPCRMEGESASSSSGTYESVKLRRAVVSCGSDSSVRIVFFL
jgi:hypothetical protein